MLGIIHDEDERIVLRGPGESTLSNLLWDGSLLRMCNCAVQGLPLRQIYLNIVTDTLRLMNEHHLMHPPLLRAIALYVIVSLNNKVRFHAT